jgi:hypothetical protein
MAGRTSFGTHTDKLDRCLVGSIIAGIASLVQTSHERCLEVDTVVYHRMRRFRSTLIPDIDTEACAWGSETYYRSIQTNSPSTRQPRRTSQPNPTP